MNDNTARDDGGDAQLGALADNGGPTITQLPAATSPIVSLVPTPSCSVNDDQRGIARPVGAGCEPGAVEVDGGPLAIEGSKREDVLVGTRGPDVIIGFGGDDQLFGRSGNDELRGGNGADKLFGGPGEDTLVGGNGPDLLASGPGRDVLKGGPGNDVLIGGRGDILKGGPGKDVCWIVGSLPTSC